MTSEPGRPTLGTATTPATQVLPAVLSRRRAWLVLIALALATAIYLTGWSAWATLHLADRYDQRAPGASASRGGAEFRLLSLSQSAQLADSSGGRTQTADPGAVFVVAVAEVVVQTADPVELCSVELLGPGGRTWAVTMVDVQRSLSVCFAGDAPDGRPYRFESVFEVPERYADALLGVVLPDRSGTGRSAVLRPPG